MIRLKTIDKVLAKIEQWLIMALLTLMVTLTFLHVALRALYRYAHFQWANIFLGHVDWTEILVRLLVLWITLLGASLLTRDNRHIKIDLMSTLLPVKWQPLRESILSIGCVLISAFMLKASIEFLKIEISFGGQLFQGFPSWLGQMIIPIGFSLILFRFLLRSIDHTVAFFRGDRV
jgi:TRAP-type C4-dicarboxylate transport system permease small subunit